jgi:hypothetical protein
MIVPVVVLIIAVHNMARPKESPRIMSPRLLKPKWNFTFRLTPSKLIETSQNTIPSPT